ncbi:MAG TPA: glycosyltransferase [Candidatus Moranbacteria bacterium]|nr:glycosyltransferase [Candidatus Moranbacteria bacterium]
MNNIGNLANQRFSNLRVALVHDFLTACGGAERVLEVMCEMFPDAPIYTLLYDREKMRGKFADKDIRTSFLQKFPKFFRKRYKWLLPLMPVAPETFDLRDFDLVISSSGAWTKGIVTRLNTVHISYFHSPMRFAWDVNGEYIMEQKKCWCVRFIARFILNYIRLWDKTAADRPDYIISNSQYTRERVKKYYGRESEIIYPPINNKTRISEQEPEKNGQKPKESGEEKEKFFLIVSRLSPYKKIDMAIEAFNKLGLPLVIVGKGEQEKYLHSISSSNIKFLGWKTDKELKEIYKKARAFVFPGVDDFGLAPVEAMNFGVPVIAIRKGGIKEILEEGKTGEFFDTSTPEVIADGVRRFMENENNYDKKNIIDKAQEFNRERFTKELEEFINRTVHAI